MERWVLKYLLYNEFKLVKPEAESRMVFARQQRRGESIHTYIYIYSKFRNTAVQVV